MNTTTNEFRGSKYDATKGLSRAEIAKLIRADIKDAVKRGTLPTAKYSVRTSEYAGGGSINVSFADVREPEFILYNAARLDWDNENPYASHCNCPDEVLALWSKRATQIVDTLNDIMQAYNLDRSDMQSDYFNVRFYGDAKPASDYCIARREVEQAASLARIESKRTATVLADADVVVAMLLADDIANDIATTSQEDFLAYLGV